MKKVSKDKTKCHIRFSLNIHDRADTSVCSEHFQKDITPKVPHFCFEWRRLQRILKSLYLTVAPTEEWVHGKNVVFAKLQFPSKHADRVVESARRLTWP